MFSGSGNTLRGYTKARTANQENRMKKFLADKSLAVILSYSRKAAEIMRNEQSVD